MGQRMCAPCLINYVTTFGAGFWSRDPVHGPRCHVYPAMSRSCLTWRNLKDPLQCNRWRVDQQLGWIHSTQMQHMNEKPQCTPWKPLIWIEAKSLQQLSFEFSLKHSQLEEGNCNQKLELTAVNHQFAHFFSRDISTVFVRISSIFYTDSSPFSQLRNETQLALLLLFVSSELTIERRLLSNEITREFHSFNENISASFHFIQPSWISNSKPLNQLSNEP